MWFKNLSNTLMNNFYNKPKLLRLDSTGEIEVTSDSSENNFTPTVVALTCDSDQHHLKKSVMKYIPISDCSNSRNWFLNSGHKTNTGDTGAGTISLSEVDTLKVPDMNGYSNYPTGLWSNMRRGSYFNHLWGGINYVPNGYGNNFHRPHNSHINYKIHPNSPWLKVNSGYCHYGGKSTDYKIPRKVREKHNSKVNSKHKNIDQDSLRNHSETTQSSLEHPDCEISSKCDNILPECSDDTTQREIISNCDSQKPKISNQKETENEREKVENQQSPSPSREISTNLTEIQKDICSSLSLTPENLNNSPSSDINRDKGAQLKTRPCIKVSKIHLSIIGSKSKNKVLNPVQDSTVKNCPVSSPNSETVPKESVEKSSDKSCTLCRAYINRVNPECTEFPKSAGCKHSIILLVRDNSKKTKKRRSRTEKHVPKKTPQSISVDDLKSPVNSHVFKFLANDSASDTDESWDSIDDDESDGALCDWSHDELDSFFPGQNPLLNGLNPVNFRVHISQVVDSDNKSRQNSFEQCNSHIENINLKWNIHIHKKSETKPETKNRKVTFKDDKNIATVYPMVAWSYAYRAARKGPWEMYARDRERFLRRIEETEVILKRVLTADHRSQISKSKYLNPSC